MKPYQHKIQYYETDNMQITHHSNYVRIMEEARIDYLERIGWAYDKLEETGIISPVTSINCKYKKTTTFPDVVRVFVSLVKCNGIIMQLAYRMVKGEEEVFTAESEHCFLDPKGNLLNIKKVSPLFYKALKQEESWES